ncbi:hypothetical protein ACFPIF_10395 [Brevundimonas faecalis]|uniref:hypothetical protein n=1 Tax=Brevundimonas faecalis TaxID=947378 RepID=UPI00360FD25A
MIRVADLFCCSGGAGYGFKLAGAHVTGFDIKPQPRYAGDDFEQRDVLTIPPEELRARFDYIHASPKCQGLTELNNDKSRHPNQIPDTRALLIATGLPFDIENVRAARPHLIDPVSLFGTMFDCSMVTTDGTKFVLSRHRLFEANWPLAAPVDPGPQGRPIANVFGGHLRCRSKGYRTGGGTGRTRDFPGEDRPALARQLMGMPWATMAELSEAVPPAMTHYIGRQFAAHRLGAAA